MSTEIDLNIPEDEIKRAIDLEEYRQSYLDSYNCLVIMMEQRGFIFNICKDAPMLDPGSIIFFPENARKFDGHELLQKCFYRKTMYNACLTFPKYKNHHICEHFPIMLGSDLDYRFLKHVSISPANSITIMRGTFFSGTTAYRIPILMANNRELPHTIGDTETVQLFYYGRNGNSVQIKADVKNNLHFRTHQGQDFVNDLSQYTNDEIFSNAETMQHFHMQPLNIVHAMREYSKLHTDIDNLSNKIIVNHVNLLHKYLTRTLTIVTQLYTRAECNSYNNNDGGLQCGDEEQKRREKGLNTRLAQLIKILRSGDWFKFVSKRSKFNDIYAMSDRSSHSNRESQVARPEFFSNVLRAKPTSHGADAKSIPLQTEFFLDIIFARSSISSFMREYSLTSNVHIVNATDPKIRWHILFNYLLAEDYITRTPVGKQIIVHSFHPTIYYVANNEKFVMMYKFLKQTNGLKCEIIYTENFVFIGMYQSQPLRNIGQNVYISAAEIQQHHRYLYTKYYDLLFGPQSFLVKSDQDARIDNFSPLQRFSVGTNYLSTAVGVNKFENINSTILSDTLVQNVFYQYNASEYTDQQKQTLNFRMLYVSDPRISLDAYLMTDQMARRQTIDFQYRYRFSFVFKGIHCNVHAEPVVRVQKWSAFLYCHLFTINTLFYPISHFSNSSSLVVETVDNTKCFYEYKVYLYITDWELIKLYHENKDRGEGLDLNIDFSQNCSSKKTWILDSHLHTRQQMSTGHKISDCTGQKGLILKMNNDSVPYGCNKKYACYGSITSLIGRNAAASLRSAYFNNNRSTLIPIFNYLPAFFKSGEMKACNYMSNSLANRTRFNTIRYLHRLAHGRTNKNGNNFLPRSHKEILGTFFMARVNFIFNIRDNSFNLLNEYLLHRDTSSTYNINSIMNKYSAKNTALRGRNQKNARKN